MYQMAIPFRNEFAPPAHERLNLTSFTVRGQDLVHGYENGEAKELFSRHWETDSGTDPPPHVTPLLNFDDGKPLWVFSLLWPPLGFKQITIDGETYTVKHLPGSQLGGYRAAGNNEEAFFRWGSPALGRDWKLEGEQATV